uniref:Disintegrin and metalloproteinase domain-containing protein 10 (Trinotate prediction) n=1 Tax=Henneguya salminicola TaxID=69463 RepID=A0A6G3MH33_HENSL
MAASSGVFSGSQHKFSPCSIESIKELINLPNRRQCLKDTVSGMCGNGVVETGEECDSGQIEDNCCEKANSINPCKLKEECTPFQGPCCNEQCKYKSSGVICFNKTECSEQSKCNSSSALCPTQTYINEDDFCLNQTAVCHSGKCIKSPCSKFEKWECKCKNKDSCKVCCKDSNSSTDAVCTPYNYGNTDGKSSKNLPPGHTCFSKQGNGICDNKGQCKIMIPISIIFGTVKFIMSEQFSEHIITWMNDSFEIFVSLISLFITIFSSNLL